MSLSSLLRIGTFGIVYQAKLSPVRWLCPVICSVHKKPTEEIIWEWGWFFMRALLVYQRTHLENCWSLEHLLMGKQMCSNLPICDSLLKDQDKDTVRETKETEKKKQIWSFGRGFQEFPVLKSGEISWRNCTSSVWDQGNTIKCNCSFTRETCGDAIVRIYEHLLNPERRDEHGLFLTNFLY